MSERQLNTNLITNHGANWVSRARKFKPKLRGVVGERRRCSQRPRTDEPAYRGDLRNQTFSRDLAESEVEGVRALLKFHIVFLKKHRCATGFVSELELHGTGDACIEGENHREFYAVIRC